MTEPPPRVRLIAIGFNVTGTGLTRVLDTVLRGLADRHEIHFLGIGYSGEIVHDRGLTIYPTNPKGGDVFAAFQAMRLIEEIRPALILVMGVVVLLIVLAVLMPIIEINQLVR